MRPEAELLTPDPRFATVVAVGVDGLARALTFSDHYEVVARLEIIEHAPAAVQTAYQRALNCFLYSWFDYELMVVAEGQAFASLELALKLKLNRPADAPPLHGLGARFKAAIDAGFLPNPDPSELPNEYYLLRSIRNELAHGSGDIHSPALAVEIFRRCAALINLLFPA